MSEIIFYLFPMLAYKMERKDSTQQTLPNKRKRGRERKKEGGKKRQNK